MLRQQRRQHVLRIGKTSRTVQQHATQALHFRVSRGHLLGADERFVRQIKLANIQMPPGLAQQLDRGRRQPRQAIRRWVGRGLCDWRWRRVCSVHGDDESAATTEVGRGHIVAGARQSQRCPERIEQRTIAFGMSGVAIQRLAHLHRTRRSAPRVRCGGTPDKPDRTAARTLRAGDGSALRDRPPVARTRPREHAPDAMRASFARCGRNRANSCEVLERARPLAVVEELPVAGEAGLQRIAPRNQDVHAAGSIARIAPMYCQLLGILSTKTGLCCANRAVRCR